MVDTVILRTNELCIKGGNRHRFERVLVEDVRRRLAPIGGFDVRSEQGSVLALHEGPLTDAQLAAARESMATVFGAGVVLFAARVSRTLEDIGAAAVEQMRAHGGKTTFKVFASRSDKSCPLVSQEVAVEVGARLLDEVPGLVVDVKKPQTRVTVDIGREHAFVAVGRLEGAGGMPGGFAGKVVALLSGGIDSPVAAFKMMRRGCRPVLVHFHSYPFVSRASIEKVERLAARLNAYLPGLELHLVPLGEAQREITVKAEEKFRVLLYRRLMFRIAEAVAARESAMGIVTGDSVGQVASQTLANLAAVSAVATVPVYRPLIGDDKEDIVTVAKKIGTYATSIEAHDDCCSLFMPRVPATKSTARQLDAEEAKYDVAALIADAMARTEVAKPAQP